MDKLFRGYNTLRKRALKVLIQRYGVKIKAYKPISIGSAYTHYDETMDYEDIPYYEGKVLIPQMLKIQQNNQFFDGLFESEDDNFLYVPLSQKLYNYSKIVVVSDETDIEDSEVFHDPQQDNKPQTPNRNLIPENPNDNSIALFKIESIQVYDTNFMEIFRKYKLIPYYSIDGMGEQEKSLYSKEEDEVTFPLNEFVDEQEKSINPSNGFYQPIS